MRLLCRIFGAMGIVALVGAMSACKEQKAEPRKSAKDNGATDDEGKTDNDVSQESPAKNDCQATSSNGANLRNECAETQDTDTSSSTSTATEVLDEDMLLQQLVNPPGYEDCITKGKLFDRTKQKCHVSERATSYACTYSGVIKVFKAIGVDILLLTQTWIGDGYELDQCGELGGEPVVFFMKKSEVGEPNVLVKKICKIGSIACGK